MNILLYGKNALSLENLVKAEGLMVVQNNPDIVISYGGDGTLLASEQEYPGIPKLPIRDSATCVKCAEHANEVLIQALAKNQLEKKAYQKLAVDFAGKVQHALNEIVITNELPIHAVRLSVLLNGQTVQDNEIIIGDGVVAATPFGSTAYFHSITRQMFDQGFGLAFNNPVHPLDPLFFTDKDQIIVTIVRGPAILSIDNNHNVTRLKENDRIIIQASKDPAIILAANSLRCPNCVIAKEKRLA